MIGAILRAIYSHIRNIIQLSMSGGSTQAMGILLLQIMITNYNNGSSIEQNNSKHQVSVLVTISLSTHELPSKQTRLLRGSAYLIIIQVDL